MFKIKKLNFYMVYLYYTLNESMALIVGNKQISDDQHADMLPIACALSVLDSPPTPKDLTFLLDRYYPRESLDEVATQCRARGYCLNYVFGIRGCLNKTCTRKHWLVSTHRLKPVQMSSLFQRLGGI